MDVATTMDDATDMDVNPATPTAIPSSRTPSPTNASTANRKKKATTPKKEMTPAERAIETNKCGNKCVLTWARNCQLVADAIAKATAEMAMVL
jgi:hypothetical protein